MRSARKRGIATTRTVSAPDGTWSFVLILILCLGGAGCSQLIPVSVSDSLPTPTFELHQPTPFLFSLLGPSICVNDVTVSDVTDSEGSWVLWDIRARDDCVAVTSFRFRQTPAGFKEGSYVRRPLACGRKYLVVLGGPGFSGDAHFSFRAACQPTHRQAS